MKILAIVLLLACIWDTVRAIRVIDQGRRERGISIDNMAFHWHMAKGVGVELILNIVATAFFIAYLKG